MLSDRSGQTLNALISKAYQILIMVDNLGPLPTRSGFLP